MGRGIIIRMAFRGGLGIDGDRLYKIGEDV